MAAINLLQGFGGQYSTTFTATSVSSTGSDTIDCSKCNTMAIVITSTSTGPSSSNIIQLQQSFDNINWINLLTAITGGTIGFYPATSQPFGLVRMIGSVANGTLIVKLTGFPLPTRF